MAIRLGYLGLFVRDLTKATTHVRDGLGLVLNTEQSIAGQYAQFDLEGGGLALFHAALAAADGASYELGLLVDDIDGVFATWKACGLSSDEAAPQEMPYGRTVRLRTPDGHPIRLIQPAPPSSQS